MSQAQLTSGGRVWVLVRSAPPNLPQTTPHQQQQQPRHHSNNNNSNNNHHSLLPHLLCNNRNDKVDCRNSFSSGVMYARLFPPSSSRFSAHLRRPYHTSRRARGCGRYAHFFFPSNSRTGINYFAYIIIIRC